MFAAKCQTGTLSLVCGDTTSRCLLGNYWLLCFVLRIHISIPADLEEFVVRPSSPPHRCPHSSSTSVLCPRSASPPPSLSSYSPSPKRPRTMHYPRSKSRDTSSPPPRAKPQAPKHSEQADTKDKVRTCDAMFLCSAALDVNGNVHVQFPMFMWLFVPHSLLDACPSCMPLHSCTLQG